MKTSRPVCILCRHRLATIATKKSSQWQTQTAAYSTDASVQSESTRGSTSGEEQSLQSSKANNGTKKTPFTIRRIPRDDPPINNFPRVKSQLSPQPPKPAEGSRPGVGVDVLFQQIVHPNTANDVADMDATDLRSLDLTLVQNVGKLQHMMDNNEGISQACDFLKTQIYPIVHQEGVVIPQMAYTVVGNFMQKVISAKRVRMHDPDLPPVSDIFRVCADFGDIRPNQWMELVGNIVLDLCEMHVVPEKYASIEEYGRQTALQERMLIDLIDSWKIFSLPKNMATRPKGHDGFWFPSQDRARITAYTKTFSFHLAFADLFPQYLPHQLGWKFSILGIATLIILMDRTRSNPIARQSASYFLKKVAWLARWVRVSDNSLRNSIRQHLPSMEGYIMDNWPEVRTYLLSLDPSAPESQKILRPFMAPTTDQNIVNAVYISKRLIRASKTGNGTEVDQLCQQLISNLMSLKAQEKIVAEAQKLSDLFNTFLRTYMAMNLPDKAIGLWNVLPKFGLKHTLEMWNVLLDGCKNARNVSGMQKIWRRLIESRMPLDIHIWTTLVAGLVDSGDIQAGLQVLEELVDRWTAAEKAGNPESAVRPSMQPVNAVLQGLIRTKNLKGAQTLVTWAIRKGIRPDVGTFNMIIQAFVRQGRDKDVMSLFETMKMLGISADETTMTIILESKLSKLDPAEDPAEYVMDILNRMQEAGLGANRHNYGKIIHMLLLRAGDGAQKAIVAVLHHMWSKGVEPSSHIYTMLVETFFRNNNLGAVDILLQRQNVRDATDVDRFLVDCVIKGYAMAGDVSKALSTYREWVSEAKYLPEIDTQFELLKGLVWAGRADEARWLVETAEKSYRQLRADGFRAYTGSAHDFWTHPFWQFAVTARIIPELPRVDPENP